MEETGPEASKRPRLDSFGGAPSTHRMHQQHDLPIPLHGFQQGQALRPPSAYCQPLPPSPYDSANDHRNLPELPHHGYSHPHSGYNTPSRETRPPYQPESYSRNGSASAPTRSPDENIQQQHPSLRPLNTAAANESQHYSHHSHPDAPTHPAGYATHEGHSNGTAHGYSMSSHHDPTYRPPTQGHAGSYSESPVGGGPAPYGGQPYSAPADSHWMNRSQPPRKNTRAQQACDTCRQRKAKCDEGKPICGYCKEQSLSCNYKEVAPAKADRAQKEIMDQIRTTQDDVKGLYDKFDRLQGTLDRLLDKFPGQRATPLQQDPPELDMKQISAHQDSENTSKFLSASHLEPNVLDHATEDPYLDHQNLVGPPAIGEATYGSVHIDHTTGAHRLLRWPSIKALLRKHRLVNEDYVLEMEEKKGLLRLYGRGQGRDTFDGGQAAPASPATSSSSVRSDDLSRSPAASPPDLWGTGLGPPAIPDARTTNPQDHPGGLNPDGSLKVDYQTRSRLLNSYLNNLHILHPFLSKTRLYRMFERFAVQTPDLGSSRPSHGSNFGPELSMNKATKRKLSNGTIGSPNDTITSGHSRSAGEQPLERRIYTAIVLLVMALGKICEHTENLPGPLTDSLKDSPQSPFPVDSSPAYNPSPSTSSNSTFSPRSGENYRTTIPNRGSAREQYERLNRSSPERNVDVLPGLAYFARATEILGSLHGGNDLPHVQAHLLAGLYASQLGCVIEGWCWIETACRACHFLIRDPTLSKERDPARADLIRFAYWTCLQLESDILAELDLRRSGIERAEHPGVKDVDYPKGVSEDSIDHKDFNRPDARMMAYYSFQISLRTTLNKIQVLLYPPGETHGRIPLSARDKCVEMLNDWLSLLPQPMQWKETDPPSEDILVARLRAKFYGAQYIIHRPFLNYALHSQEFKDSYERPTLLDDRRSSSSQIRSREAMAPPSTNEKYSHQEVLRSAKLCVEAAMRSTEAFDGVCKTRRLIVTNIFGTAHAQFGNMLVLAATYRSHLRNLVEKGELIRLLDRTIFFLRKLRPISPTLATDAHILEGVQQIINDDQASSSFSSANS